MIQKTNNNAEDFYNLMGRFFGSRIVYSITKDRLYDDNDKDWYLYIEKKHVSSFVSISQNKIKNVYSTNRKHLAKLLNYLFKNIPLNPSIVTKAYLDTYKECNLNIDENSHKNFVKIWRD